MRHLTRILGIVAIAGASAVSAGALVLYELRSPTMRGSATGVPSLRLIIGPAECDGALDFLTLFERPDVMRRLLVEGMFLTGSSGDSLAAAELMRAHGIHTTIHRAGIPLRLERTALGYSSAVIVITDARGRILLAHALPENPAQFAALGDLLATFPLQ